MVVSRVINEYYTHNNFKTYDECKRKYYYEYIRKLHWPSLASNFELGLSVHKLLDYQAKGMDVSFFITDAKDDIRELWTFLESSEIIKKQVIASEWAFNVRLSQTEYWLQGRVDRIIKQSDSEMFTIIDFKTGQQLPSTKKTDWQSILYLYCVSEARKIKPENLEFLYYKVDLQPEIRQIAYSEALHRDYEKMIAEKIERIESTTSWLPEENCKNKYCQYRELCRKIELNYKIY